jgi:predicted dehydrogenase
LLFWELGYSLGKVNLSEIVLTVEHLPAIEKSGLYEIKAVYSRSKKSAEALIPKGSIDIYSDDSGPGKGLDDLLSRKDIHAVDVVLPITHQPAVIKKSLQAGKHVVRPITTGANPRSQKNQ